MFLRKSFIFVAIFALLFALLVFGCSPAEDPDDGDENGVEAIEVILGYTGPLSGPAAEYGQDGLNGILMAVDDINAAGGIEIDGQVYTFKVNYHDDKANPTETMSAVDRLLDAGVNVIFNMVYTSTAPMLEINREAGSEFIVMAYTSSPFEYQHANPLAIWLPPPFPVYAQAMTEIGRLQEGWVRCASVVDNGAYGQGWMGVFRQYWEAYGGEWTATEMGSYYAEQDFNTQITAALATNPDVLLIGGPSGGTSLVIEQAREQGFEGGFIILDQAKMDWIAVNQGGSLENLENAIGVVAPHTSHYPATVEFDRRYVEQYVNTGKATVTTWEAAIHYTATRMLVNAMQSAGTVEDCSAIVAAIPDVLPMMGEDYPYEYAGITDGLRMKGIGSVTIVKDGDYSPAASILWWPRSEEEFAAQVEISTVAPEVDPMWIPFPPLP